jgi:glucosamine--fructose-6-phosphate aminotransferase (isomerizing)
MCGIFGLFIHPHSKFSSKNAKKIIKKLALLSQNRGLDSSGVAFKNYQSKSIQVLKGDIPAKQLFDSDEYLQILNNAENAYHLGKGFYTFGHARLVTNGSQLKEVNNQPVIKDDMVVVHNGIIVNNDDLWSKYNDLKRLYDIDTEIVPSLIRHKINQNNSLIDAIASSCKMLQGTYSLGIQFADFQKFVLTTNNGSVYYTSVDNDVFIFASERFIIHQLLKEKEIDNIFSKSKIHQLLPNQILLFDEQQASCQINNIDNQIENSAIEKVSNFSIEKRSLKNNSSQKEVVIDPSIYINRTEEEQLIKLLEYNIEEINSLKRCSRCLLPETFPFIEFDDNGVCNYCHNHKPMKASNTFDDLLELVEPYRNKSGKPDCIVPFSGGRDSTYSLHIVKKELGLNPIAFTYDWGMVTDLARRNIARVCGKLGVENIIVSADIRWKRENIRKNVLAWLNNPQLGMIPLFMAGDKYFFYYCNQVKKQTGIDLNIWGINDLENTNFKTGFAGLKPIFNKKTIYSLSLQNKVKLFSYVGKNLIQSPGYINNSIIDSLGSFAARYVSPKKDYYHLFDYYQWNEDDVNNLVKNEYDWELAIDTSSTWRIGDGTASFYNYIYYTVAGFSEFDTFRSNQIREGMLDRETALKLINEENRPRYETLRWYLQIVGLDFETTIKKINSMDKIYKIR